MHGNIDPMCPQKKKVESNMVKTQPNFICNIYMSIMNLKPTI